MLSTFSFTFWSLDILFGNMSISFAFCLIVLFFFFFFFCYWCMSSLYILNFKGLLDAWLANILCHSVGCLFILLTVSFSVQKLLSWYSPIWLCFKFFAYTFGITSKSHCRDLRHSTFLLCYSLWFFLDSSWLADFFFLSFFLSTLGPLHIGIPRGFVIFGLF